MRPRIPLTSQLVTNQLRAVCSLVGVVLIARPTFIFGAAALPVDGGVGVERGTPAERLGAVGVALIGVLGATGACEPRSLSPFN